MMRSQLSRLEKLDMGRVRRRTSRKARSMTLVVRTLIQWACGTAKKFNSASRSRSTQATGVGSTLLPALLPLLKSTVGLTLAGGAIDGRGFGHTRAFFARHLIGNVSEFVGPAALHRDTREDQRQGRL